MTQADRLVMRWRPAESKSQRLERVAAEMRAREGHKRGGNSAERAARMRAIWARRKGAAA